MKATHLRRFRFQDLIMLWLSLIFYEETRTSQPNNT